MKSLHLIDQGKFFYTVEQKTPSPAENETLLNVEYCGICRTDAKMWNEGQRDLRMPRVLGHEFCGMDSTGKRFVVWPAQSCGSCNMCSSGYENLCPDIEIIGFHRDGGMSECVAVPDNSLIELPLSLPAECAIFAEPAACAINALEQLGVFAFDGKCESRRSGLKRSLLVIGGGTCGLLTAICAKEFGVDVTVVENSLSKIKKSAPFSRKAGILITGEFQALELFDYCINASSSTESFTDALPLLRSGGKYCIFSGLNKNDQISAALLNTVHYRQLTVCGAYGCTKLQMRKALDILSRHTSAVEMLIEDVIKLDYVEEKMAAVFAGCSFRYIISYT